MNNTLKFILDRLVYKRFNYPEVIKKYREYLRFFEVHLKLFYFK